MAVALAAVSDIDGPPLSGDESIVFSVGFRTVGFGLSHVGVLVGKRVVRGHVPHLREKNDVIGAADSRTTHASLCACVWGNDASFCGF